MEFWIFVVSGLVKIAEELDLLLLAPRKKINVLLIGNHSAGKSSFINWSVSFIHLSLYHMGSQVPGDRSCVNQSLNSAGRVTMFCVRHALLSTSGLKRFRDFVRVNPHIYKPAMV